MKTLHSYEVDNIFDRNSNSNWEAARNTGSRSQNRGGSYGAVDSCGFGILGGLVAGAPGGPLGMATGVLGGMIAGQCKISSFSRSNGRSQNSNASSERNLGGQCTW